jgi:protein gp37
MAENSKIEWCHHTFNPWIGCTKVSAGCAHCYAENLMDTRYGKVQWGPQGTRVRTSPANWRKPIKWNEWASKGTCWACGGNVTAGKPCPVCVYDGTVGRPYRARVFCASLADVFEGRPELDEWLVDLLLMVDATPHLDWLLLTKRPENYAKLLPTSFQKHTRPNLWLGTSVEDQPNANVRVPHLLSVNAVVHFVSYEPALGPVRFGGWLPRVNWVIVGGESGGGARPFETAWARSVIEECAAAKSAAFIKQLGAQPYASDWEGCSPPMHLKSKKGGDPDEWPEYLRVREFPTIPTASTASC